MADDQQVGPGLYVRLGLDYNGIIGGIGGVSLALNQSLELFSKFEGMAQGFINLANNAGRLGKEIKDNARDLGLSTTEYQQWSHAAIAAGSNAEEITGSIRMMSVRIKEAIDPTSAMGKQFAALGVSALDSSGHMRSMNDILLDLFPALNKLPEGFARNQAAQEIFGRNFTNIADLAGMTREELQGLIDQAPVFSDAKVEQLNAYNTQMNLLNEKMERSKSLAGSELVSSFSTWGNMIDTSLQKGQPLFVFFQDLNLILEMVAEGITLLGARIVAFQELINPASGKFGDFTAFGNTISAADSSVGAMRSQFALTQSGYFEGAVWDKATGTWIAKKSTGSEAPVLTPSTPAATPDTNSKSSSPSYATWASTSVVGSVGSEMQLFMQKEMEAGTSYQDALQNWSNGSPTNTNKFGTLGAVTNGSPAGPASTKTATPGTSDQTKIVETEYDTQGKALETLTTKVQKEYSKQGDAFTDYLNRIAVESATQYPVLEKLDLIHWATSEEIAKIALQKVIDFMAEAVNFGGLHPIIQNLVVMSKSGPDWTPPAFQSVSATTLTSADFTQVGQNVQNIVNAGLGQGTSADVKVVQNITNNIAADVDQASADQVNKTQVAATNRALAGVSYLGGSMI